MGTKPGIKLDTGKQRPGLMIQDFANALQGVTKVSTFGANKYTDHGWLHVENAKSRYTDALYRHLFAYTRGEIYDKESGIHHLAHAAWNVLALLEFEIRGKK